MKFIKPVYAHCDVPCGIYETNSMTHAAFTCAKMIEKISALGEIDSVEKTNTLTRMILQKEEHAQKCKDQLYLLWSDYFKPEHLERFPSLHNTFWIATKQCSKVKQTVSGEECQKLIDMVHDIAHMFVESNQG